VAYFVHPHGKETNWDREEHGDEKPAAVVRNAITDAHHHNAAAYQTKNNQNVLKKSSGAIG